MTKDFILIERYFKFQLSEEELSTFEQLMKDDAVFANLVYKYHASQKSATEFYTAEEEKKRKADWRNLLEQDEQHEKNKNTIIYLKRLVAAVVVILLGVALFFVIFSTNKNQQWDELLAEARTMSPEVEIQLLRGSPENKEDELFKDAYSLYLGKEYKSAILLFNKVQEDSKHYEDALLLTAISHYYVKEYETSLTLLDSLKDVSVLKYETVGLWYTSLNYLEQDKSEEAIPSLQKLSDSDNELSEKAKQLKQLILHFQSE